MLTLRKLVRVAARETRLTDKIMLIIEQNVCAQKIE